MINSSTQSQQLQTASARALRTVGAFNLGYPSEDKQQVLASNTKMLGGMKNQVAEFHKQQKED